MTQDRLRRRDSLRCRCEEDRAYVTSVVLPSRAVVRVLLRWWRDADPVSASAPLQQGSSFLKGPAFPSHIRRFASPAAQMTSCDDYRVGLKFNPGRMRQSQKCIRGCQYEKDTNCALVPDN